MPPNLNDKFLFRFEATDFPQKSKNTQSVQRLRWAELLHAAMTVGKYHSDYLTQRKAMGLELQYKLLTINAFFDINPEIVDPASGDSSTGALVHASGYEELDSSEKGAVAFQFGMAMCQLYARKCLDVRWMMHVSRAVHHGNQVNFAVDDRPDLYGMDSFGRWTVAEAKGRVSPTQELFDKMRAQKSSVKSVNNNKPRFRYASATRRRAKGFDLRVIDPPAAPDAINVELSTAEWLVDYYAPILVLFGDGDGHDIGPTATANLPAVGITVGMPRALLTILMEYAQRIYSRRESQKAGDRMRDPDARYSVEDRAFVEAVIGVLDDTGTRESGGSFSDGLVLSEE